MPSSQETHPVEQLPPIPLDDGLVESPQLPEGFDRAKYWQDGEIGAALGEILYQVWREIMDGVSKDNAGRGQFTQRMVSTLRSVFPDFNWMCVHTSHTIAFDGKEGKDWAHGHGTFDLTIGGVIGYEIYGCRTGVFVLHGDGGYQNWAWMGRPKGQSSDGRIIMW